MKSKEYGQVITPLKIVKDILNIANYKGERILKKHVIDNSCGDGAFLTLIVTRYIEAYLDKHHTINGLKEELEKYIHGIDCDPEIIKECLNNLKKICHKYHLNNVNFDLLNKDALTVNKYDGKMDYVLGNPPYVRVHNLKNEYQKVKKFSFSKKGMTDLYIAFYEIGLNMLNNSGTLCYISPNSFYNSLAGSKFRKYLEENHNLEALMDLGHYQPFTASAYTTICKIRNGSKVNECKYYKYDIKTGKPKYITDINYDDLFINGNIILTVDNTKFLQYLRYDLKKKLKIEVKNGFATLRDNVFIQKEFNFNQNTIDVIKGSTGEWKKCIFPYDQEGHLISFNNLDKKVQKYLLKNKNELLQSQKDNEWYAFGRTQAIKDVSKNKISINTCIKDLASIRLNIVKENQGIYSGLYILTDLPYNVIKECICSSTFIEYLKVINKCKRGGYYTFSSKDLAKYLNCCLEDYNG